MVDPIPDPAFLDLLTIKELTLFLIFFFAVGFTFFNVPINVAPVSALPNPRRVISVAVGLKKNL